MPFSNARDVENIDKSKILGALLTELLKAFYCLDDDLIIAKLNAYGFRLSVLRLIHDYLSNRKQRARVNNSSSDWHEVSQGSILGPLLFNIFLADLFLTLNDVDIANFADMSKSTTITSKTTSLKNF